MLGMQRTLMQKRKINLLILSHSAGRYGAEKSLLLLLQNLDQNRFNPVVVFPSEGPLKKQVDLLGIRSFVVSIPWWIRPRNRIFEMCRTVRSEIKAQFQLRRIVKSEKIDLIYSNTMVIFSGAILAKLTNLPHVWHIREILPGNENLLSILPIKLVLKLIPNCTELLIANSGATLQQFGYQVDEKRRIVYNAINVPEVYKYSGGDPEELI